LEVRNLKKAFVNKRNAVDDISF